MAFRNGKASCGLCDTSSGGGTPSPTPIARRRIQAIVTTNVPADTDVSGPSDDGNLDVDLGVLSGLNFGTSTSRIDILLNGVDQRQGVDSVLAEDVYPGTSLTNGQIRFKKKLKSGQKITIIDWDE